MSEVELPPLRSLNDFLLDSARFQLPNFKDFDKWANRVLNNLIYYQSNYFLLSFIIFFIVGVTRPYKMLCGMVANVLAFIIFYYFSNSNRNLVRFKNEHPLLSVLIVLTSFIFIVYMLGTVLVFLTGIIMPICVIFIHASMRLRNIKNKIANKMEFIGIKKTSPMAILLEELGMEPDLLS